jgi:phospholipid/cholesterol/gamma-HCH transport system substrate-binding protein
MHISKEVKTGLIAIVALALTVWGYNFLKGKNILKSTDEYYVVFERIDGLIESGTVYYKGFKVGNINSIKFDQGRSNKFILKITLEQRIHIPKGSIVKVMSTNPIASASDLEIIFGDQPGFYQSGDTLQSVISTGLMGMLDPLQAKLGNVLSGLDSLLQGLNQVLGPESQESLKGAIADLGTAVNSLKRSLSNGGDLSNSFAHLESVTGNLESKNDEISETLDNLAGITSDLERADLYTTISSLDSTLHSIRGIMAKIDQGEGTLGSLINDSSLYTNLDSTAYHLDALLKDLKENPGRYVQVSVFGKKDKKK